MSFFGSIFGKGKRSGSYSARYERARELHGQVIKYVTERKNNNDDVIGRGGALTVHEDNFIVDSSGDRIFMCRIADLEASYLMSGDGVVIKAPDLLQDGKERTITAHFVYHRK